MTKKSKKVINIKAYQSVLFAGKQQTFFTTVETANVRAVELDLIEGINCIEVKSKDDHILIPLTNVASISLKEKVEKKKAISNVGIKASEIKRPR